MYVGGKGHHQRGVKFKLYKTFFGLPKMKPWTIVHGFQSKSEKFDSGKKQCSQKEHLKRSRMAKKSALQHLPVSNYECGNLHPIEMYVRGKGHHKRCRNFKCSQLEGATRLKQDIGFLFSFPTRWYTFITTFFGLPKIKPWTIVHGFRPKAENCDAGKK